MLGFEKNVRIGTQVTEASPQRGQAFVTRYADSDGKCCQLHSIKKRNPLKSSPDRSVEDLYKKCQEKALGNGNAASKFEGSVRQSLIALKP